MTQINENSEEAEESRAPSENNGKTNRGVKDLKSEEMLVDEIAQ